MTDSRLPDPWLGHPEFSVLSDGAWRLFTHTLMWSNRYGTNGEVNKLFYPDLHVRGDILAYLMELFDAEIAIPTADGFLIEWEKRGQSLASDVEKRRQQNRERKARQRERDIMRDGMREVGQDRQGQDDTF